MNLKKAWVEILKADGTPEDEARRRAARWIDIGRRLGLARRQFYFPELEFDRTSRDASIRQAWTGRNATQLAMRFGVNERTIRRIVTGEKK